MIDSLILARKHYSRRWRHRSGLTVRRIFVLCCAFLLAASAVLAANPSILFLAPHDPTFGWVVDLHYLEELHAGGFEVDYTVYPDEATFERLTNYNAVVVFMTPDAYYVALRGMPSDQQRIDSFVNAVEQYLAAGGGVLLFPGENNIAKQHVIDLTDRWGAKIPAERIVENDPAKKARMSHSSQNTLLAFTDQVFPSPVSTNVSQVWYPINNLYYGQQGGPIWVDTNDWQVVMRASPTSVTEPVDFSAAPYPPPNPFQRPGGVAEPEMFAIRTFGAGRVALLNQWRQFSVGSGTRWIFNREVLEKGLGGQSSHFGLLLENTYRWLAAPSLQGGGVGGYVTPADRLLPPNESQAVKDHYAEHPVAYDADALDTVTVSPSQRMYRGLIGAKSAFSTGQGTVAEYAQAARQAGLDFVIFLEDFTALTEAELDQLKTECEANTDDTLVLIPGFHIASNIGDHMYFYSPDPVWPDELVLTGPDNDILYIQEEDANGDFTGYLTPFLSWVLGAYHVDRGQVGFFNFGDSPVGMRMHSLRLYAAVGLRYYRNGALVEDVTDDYLVTAQSTIPPAPHSINEVTSPAELIQEAQSGHALTYALATSLDLTHWSGIWKHALRWSHAYDSLPVFCSDGPIIHAWNGCHRVMTYGGEDFVRGRSVMKAPLWVEAPEGLKEIRIYNGAKLYRRFLFDGETDFMRNLYLDAAVQKNLVLIAEDQAGGKAVSFARRCYREGALSPSFCSDQVNDGHMYLAHGPYQLPYIKHPVLPVDIAGSTWDGGPAAVKPLFRWAGTIPVLTCDQGTQDAWRMDLIPILECADDGAVAVNTVRRENFSDRLLNIVNPWHTYGPLEGPDPLCEHVQSYREYVRPTIGVPDNGWAAPGVRVGANASLLANKLTFQEDLTITSLQLGRFTRDDPSATFVLHTNGTTRSMEMAYCGNPTFELGYGDWFGLCSTGLANAEIHFNRGDRLRLKFGAYMELMADVAGQSVQPGDTYTEELASVAFPVDVPITNAAGLERCADYLHQPEGLDVVRGTRHTSPGLLEFNPVNYGIEVRLPSPTQRVDMTVPVRIRGLNPRWSAGLLQVQGYSKGFYGSGANRYRELGIDFDGYAYVPLHVDYAGLTWIRAGHPIVADGANGAKLFIQVTNISTSPSFVWHIAVNNPSDQVVATTLRRALDMPGLVFDRQAVSLQPGEHRFLPNAAHAPGLLTVR